MAGQNRFLSAAIHYAELGYPVFPCVPGTKKPLTEHGFKDATTDPAQIEAWWTEHPNANVGIATAGLVVIDIDGAGNAWLADDPEKAESLACGPMSLTPRGGRHHVFRQPAGRSWGSSSGKLAPKVDVRANGGYIVAPPSATEDGAYAWAETFELDVPPDRLPEPPAWLAALLDGPEHPQPVASTAGNPIPSGQRNVAVARLAGAMRRVGMTEAELLAAIERVNVDRCQPPLPASEIRRIATSVARYQPDQISVALAEDHFGQDMARNPAAAYMAVAELLEEYKTMCNPIIHGLLREGEIMNVIAAPKTGKALAVDTPVLTDRGWLTMADLRPGMKVHAHDGTLTEIVAATEVMHGRPCYRVTTKSGASVIADAEHLWVVRQRSLERVVRTRDLPKGHQGRRWLLPVAGALERDRVDLPLDPWLLGYWLGNGTSSSGDVTINTHDMAHVRSHIQRAGFTVGRIVAKGGATTMCILGLNAHLRQLGLLNNKHIPQTYLLASRQQRAALLAGLMDSDGYAATSYNGSGQIEFCSTSPTLAEQAMVLIRSLGFKTGFTAGRARLNGKDCGPCVRISFVAGRRNSPFSLPRKTNALPRRTPAQRARVDAVVSVEPVPSVPVRCIQVAHPSGTYLAGEWLMVTHNSWIVLDLALSVVAGRPWLDFATERGRVLLLDNELHPQTLANRIPRVAQAMGLSPGPWGQDFCVKTLRGQLQDLFRMEEYFKALPVGHFKLIILDAFYRFMPRDMDENDNGTMANLYNLLDRWAARLAAAFVLIHHTTKGLQSEKGVTDVGAGAGSQSRAADCHFILRPHEQDGCLSVDAVARSWPSPPSFVLRQQFPLWVPDHTLDPKSLKKPNRKQPKASQEEAPDEPLPDWTPEQFVEAFLAPEPRSRPAILLAANEHDLSDYRAGKFLERAEAKGLVHRWALDHNRIGYATEPQETLPLAGEANEELSKRAKVLAAVKENPGLSSREIAGICGVSVRYVQQIRSGESAN